VPSFLLFRRSQKEPPETLEKWVQKEPPGVAHTKVLSPFLVSKEMLLVGTGCKVNVLIAERKLLRGGQRRNKKF
jgi:hypothetical protein